MRALGRRDVKRRSAELFRVPGSLPGIDLRADQQLERARQFAPYLDDFPFTAASQPQLRFRLGSGRYADGDAIALYCMLRHIRPRTYLEIGSGWSSALALDVNEQFLEDRTVLMFVESHPAEVKSLLRAEDHAKVQLMRRPLSDLPSSLFDVLQSGDVLSINSSHTSRVGSDVNQLFLDVLPRLPAGVHIQVSEIHYPFEYPPDQARRSRSWNEAYLLRAYLTRNNSMRITWFNSYLRQFHAAAISTALPGWAADPGSSIWLETLP